VNDQFVLKHGGLNKNQHFVVFLFSGLFNMEQQELIMFWVNSSDMDFEAMVSLYDSKHYNWALFVGHLVIEKLLKACYVKVHNEHPPMIHNLLRLALKVEIKMDKEKEDFFGEVTEFNITARYEDFKLEFYKKCTQEYTQQWITDIKKQRQWIKREHLKL
jgi:HEPN domain-containing protein